jgi:hypothetical protein
LVLQKKIFPKVTQHLNFKHYFNFFKNRMNLNLNIKIYY